MMNKDVDGRHAKLFFSSSLSFIVFFLFYFLFL